MSDIHASTSARIISSRCYLFKAINIHQRLISQRLSYRKLRNCITPLNCWQDIKPHIAKEWKQKDKICLQLSWLEMMAWSHSTGIFNFLRMSKLNLGQTASAELEKWHQIGVQHISPSPNTSAVSLWKQVVKLDLIYAWNGGYLVYSNAEKVKWINSGNTGKWKFKCKLLS